MLSFANPWAFALLGFLVPVVLLFFLRMRFKRQPVGSAFIWRLLADKNSGGNRLRFRSILLLLLQVAAVCLAALSAAGPTLESRRLLIPGTAFIIDASASMSCRDSARSGLSRLEKAKRMASDALKALPALTPAMVFAGSSSPELVWSGRSGSEGVKAIEGIRQEEGAFLEDDAVLSIEPELAEKQGAWRAVVFTDGGMDLGGRRLAAAFEGAIEFENLGEPVDDSGISGLSVASAGSGATASFTLFNGTAKTLSRRANLALGGRVVASAEISMPPGPSRSSISMREPAQAGRYEISFDDADAYALNDWSCFALGPSRGLSVLLVGKRDPYIEAAMAFQGISVTNMENLPDKIDANEWDFVIVNGVASRSDLKCNLAVFGALPSGAPGEERYTVSGYLSSQATDHPLERFLRWDDGARATGKAIELQPGAQAIASIKGAPVMIAWEDEGFRSFACTVDMASSDLGLSQAFPVLMRNLIQWFVPGAEGFSSSALRVGEGVWMSEGTVFAVDDKRVSVAMTGTRARVTAFSRGLFEWRAAGRSGYLAVNVPESELDPAPRSIAQPEDRPNLSSVFSAQSRPLMRLPIVLLVICLIAEWFLWSGLPFLKAKAAQAKNKGRRSDAR